MNLRELLTRDFGTDFPISGGSGSKDSPIVIHRVTPNDYTAVEYGVLQCLGIGRGIEWKLVQQSLISCNDRSMDQIKIETVKETDTEIITQIENFYFDITECI